MKSQEGCQLNSYLYMHSVNGGSTKEVLACFIVI